MINDLPTIFEVVTGNAKQPKDQSAPHNNSSKNKSSGKVVSGLVCMILFVIYMSSFFSLFFPL